MKNFLDILGVLSMILGISLSTVTTFTYNYGEHRWFDILGATFVCSIGLLILGILQVVSTGVVLSSRNRQDKSTFGIIGWIATQFLIVLGIFSCYIVLNYASLELCHIVVPEYASVSMSTMFHIVILSDLVFLIFCVMSTLWVLPKLIIEEIYFKREHSINHLTFPYQSHIRCRSEARTRAMFQFQPNSPIFTLDSPQNSAELSMPIHREFPPGYFEQI